MSVSKERLISEAEATGFSAAMLEKVLNLLAVLDALNRHPATSGKLALKGGTAINLFLFDVPRLSVDIDLNYVGSGDRDTMLQDRPKVLAAVRAICQREGLTVRNERGEHAATSFDLRYASALGGGGNLKIDMNFITRVPLWEPCRMDSHPIGSVQLHDVLVMDRHEIVAGKLAALLSRQTSRDLYDAYRILCGGLSGDPLDPEKLRVAFTVYGGFNLKDWRTVGVGDVSLTAKDLKSYLAPLLRQNTPELAGSPAEWAKRMASECRDALSAVLPLTEKELAFIEKLNGDGEVAPELLTDDIALTDRIARHPALQWKALNVRDFKKGVRRNLKGSGIE